MNEGFEGPDESLAGQRSGRASWRKGQRAAMGDMQDVDRKAGGQGEGILRGV